MSESRFIRHFVSVAFTFFVVVPCIAQETRKSTLNDVSWLIGLWKNADDGNQKFEERWSDVAGGAMVGTFRLLVNDKPAIYEFLMLEQDESGVTMTLRHYRSKMVDVDQAPIRLRLAEFSGDKLVFENPENDKPKRVVYTKDSQGILAVAIETQRDSKPVTFTLKFRRMAEGAAPRG